MNFNRDEMSEKKWFIFLQKYWLYIVVIIAVIIVALSSVKIYREEILEIDPAVKTEPQSTLSFASAYLDTLNPIVSKSEDTYYISKLIYNSLFDYTDSLNVEGDLAESYTVNTEKAYIDITLKQGILWHNGDSFNSGDVSFTVNAIKSYGSGGLYYEKASRIRNVDIKDDSNLRIYFNNADDCSLDSLVFPILPKKEYKSAAALIKETDDFIPIGTGMYKYSSYDALKELKLDANESFFGTKAQNSINIKILPEKSMASNMMEIDAVTCYTDIGSDRKSLVEDKNFVMYDMISNDVDFIVFNTDNPLLASKKVRKGICYAIDEKSILSEGYMDDGILTDTIYYPGFLGVADSKDTYAFNREKASEVLAGEGYEDRDLNGKLEDKDGNEVSVNLLVNNNNANRIAAARIMEKNLEQSGFDVSVKSVDWEEYNSLIEEKDFDILLTGYEVEASYDLRSFFDGTNPWAYENTELLEKVNELDRLHTAEEYTSIYSEVKKTLVDEAQYYPLCYKKMGLIGVETFEAGKLPMFNNIYKNCSTWSWKKKITEEKNNKNS
ncbi:MAG: hypothetical protein DBY08_02380 [Clostridiales bacterium]|nr:MAG: hypothetical protein DBY08_02380 [Clostridiales bacterium]